jgi:hypothetical protein
MLVGLLAIGCTNDVDLPPETPPSTDFDAIDVVDRALESGYLDIALGHFERGRANTIVDIDLDGDPDVISGNPGDTTYVIVNDTEPGGPLRFHRGQDLDVSGFAYWTIGAGDLDNDSDPDLFVGIGGNEGALGFDRVFRNDGDPEEPFVDISNLTGVLSTVDAQGDPLPHATAGALLFDFDENGLLDVFASNFVNRNQIPTLQLSDVTGLPQLWRNLGGIRFENVGPASGILKQLSSRHSVFLDLENDGDLDIFQNNFDGGSTVWRNRLREEGVPAFEDVTALVSLNGGDLSYPRYGGPMATIATDLDQDGWEDLFVFRRNGPKELGEPAVHAAGHLVWMNQQGNGFLEVANHTSINDTYVWRDHDGGVMGCQIADWNADGYPDIFIGNGGPTTGEASQLFVSTERTEVYVDGVGTVTVPQFEDWSALLDFPAELPADWAGAVPPYPYRTHGTAAGDFDQDGYLELAVHNGGPMSLAVGPDEEMQEPDRLYQFQFPDPKPHWLWVDVVGDGVIANSDGIGAKVHVTIERPDGSLVDLYNVRRTQTGFSAQNEGGVHFGLGDAVAIVSVEVIWPDGQVDVVDAPDMDQRLVVTR